MLTTRHPVFIFWGPELFCLYNDAYAASLGPEKHPFVLGRSAPEAWPEAYPLVEPELKQVMAGGEATWQESTLVPIRRNGRIEQVYWTYSHGPIHDADAPNGVGGVLTFITETTRTIVAQRETEDRYRMLFEALDQGFCVVDVVFDERAHPIDYVFVEVNSAFTAQTDLLDAAGKSMRAMRPDHEEHWFETYGRIALTGEPERFEHEAAALGRWYDVFAYRVGDPERRRVAILFDDITERKRAEKALSDSEERLRQVQEAARIGSFDFDRTTNKTIASPEYLDLYGLPHDRSGSLSYEDWIAQVHPEDRPHIKTQTREAVADPARHQLDYDFRIIRADTQETRWVTARIKLVRNADGRFVRSLGAQWDVTGEKVAEERRNLLIHELNHRVKNTLATVQSITSQTLRNTKTAVDAKEAIEERLIALSRAHDVLTRESWEKAGLYELVEQAVAPYSNRGENRLHLAGPKVRLSPRIALALAMMLQELATNAVEYGALSNGTGEIRITWAVVQGTPSHLSLWWEESGGPPVQTPTRRGFGTRLIERSLAQDLAGQVRMEYATTGVVCTVEAPLLA
jgi:PAS domain S-box-containing protein